MNGGSGINSFEFLSGFGAEQFIRFLNDLGFVRREKAVCGALLVFCAEQNFRLTCGEEFAPTRPCASDVHLGIKMISNIFRSVSLVLAVVASPGLAQESGAFGLELNDAQTNDAGACVLTYVIRNQTETSLQSASYEVGIQNKEGRYRLLTLKFGATDAGDTRFTQFVLSNSSCESINEIVINNVTECEAQGSETASDVCKDAMELTSSTAIRFFD